MITVGQILASIRRNKDYQQKELHKALSESCSLGQIRDIEAGRTPYIKPRILIKWIDWLELSELESQFLLQENIRCLFRHELKDIGILRVNPQLLGAIADLITAITGGKQVEVGTVVAELTRHNLPHLLRRPPYIDSIMTIISKEQNE